MTQLFCSDNLSSRAVAVLTRTKPGQPARPALLVSPHYLEAEEHEFCTPGVFKCLQWPLYRTRWNPVWDTDHFYCCPSKALININYSSADAQGIIPSCCTGCARSEYTSPWTWAGKMWEVSSCHQAVWHCRGQFLQMLRVGELQVFITHRHLATGTKKWLELMF